MFLKQLYNYSKPTFGLYACVLSMLVFVLYKRGISVAPFIPIKMFSAPVRYTDTLRIITPTCNSRVINLQALTYSQLDLLNTYTAKYYYQQSDNTYIATIMLPYATILGLKQHYSAAVSNLNTVPAITPTQYLQQLIPSTGAVVWYKCSYTFTPTTGYKLVGKNMLQ